jgi:hypothetical protein
LAGQLANVALGVQYKLDQNWRLSPSLGWHYAASDGTSGTARFSRYPLELLLGYEVSPGVTLSVGGRKSFNAHGVVNGSVGHLGNADFDASAGAVLETEWLVNEAKKTIIVVRLVKEEFTKKSTGEKFNGSHIGFGFKVYF